MPRAPRAASTARHGVRIPRVLVLAPTRELAQQVADAGVQYGQYLRVRTVCIYGGAPYPSAESASSRAVSTSSSPRRAA